MGIDSKGIKTFYVPYGDKYHVEHITVIFEFDSLDFSELDEFIDTPEMQEINDMLNRGDFDSVQWELLRDKNTIEYLYTIWDRNRKLETIC